MLLDDELRKVPLRLSVIAEQLGNLFHSEVRLAKAEVSQKVDQILKGTAMLIGAAVFLVPVLVVLLFTIALWLEARGWTPVSAHLTAALVGLAGSCVLLIAAMRYLKDINPDVTARELGRDVDAVREMMK